MNLSGRSFVLVFDLANSVWADLEAETSAAVACPIGVNDIVTTCR